MMVTMESVSTLKEMAGCCWTSCFVCLGSCFWGRAASGRVHLPTGLYQRKAVESAPHSVLEVLVITVVLTSRARKQL